ncbi:hypothetical protein PHJA_001718200 [Phtheirospermum japonicum]|uniref:Uncharacterized protein n=1 Tax=Phtheirospermum japonicum TaxID=374723 RepID=A0A830C866_9LAMI|nr:hypothetical protein PHJA_001718200 [Phtheirospermum japonicum]
MATASLSALHLLHLSKFSSINAHNFSQNSFYVPSSPIYKTPKSKSLKLISFALTESSDSPKSLDTDPQILLKELADCFVLPEDYFRQLPRDIRLDLILKPDVHLAIVCSLYWIIAFIYVGGRAANESSGSRAARVKARLELGQTRARAARAHKRVELEPVTNKLASSTGCSIIKSDYPFSFSMLKLNDAAFDLSNGPVKDECGEELGEILLNISRAWEIGDTSTSASLVSKLPLRFQSMGQYGEGELQKTGKILSTSPITEVADGEAKQEPRVLKFGELQVELTPEKAYTGAVIAVIFGILSWQVSQGIQSIPESSLEYANDNALLLAKSLRGALLAVFYSSTILCAFSTIGLILLGGQLKSKGK